MTCAAETPSASASSRSGIPSAAAGSASIRASWPPPMTATVGASSVTPETLVARPGPSYGDRLDVTEAAHRPGRQRARLELLDREQARGVLVDDHPVAPGHRGQPGGEVDRRAEHVAHPHHGRA